MVLLPSVPGDDVVTVRLKTGLNKLAFFGLILLLPLFVCRYLDMTAGYRLARPFVLCCVTDMCFLYSLVWLGDTPGKGKPLWANERPSDVPGHGSLDAITVLRNQEGALYIPYSMWGKRNRLSTVTQCTGLAAPHSHFRRNVRIGVLSRWRRTNGYRRLTNIALILTSGST